MKKRLLLIPLLCFVLVLSACYFPIRRKVPPEGEYYCDELKISIDFSVYAEDNPKCAKIYSSDDEYTIGLCMRDYGTGMNILSLDQEICYVVGEYLYADGVFTITAHEDGTVYTFERID